MNDNDIDRLNVDVLDEKPLGETIEQYWHIFKRRWPIVVLITLMVVGFRMFQVYRQTPFYVAKGTLMIEKENQNMLSLRYMPSYNDWRNEYLNTQLRILRSRSLGKKVIEELRLLETINTDGKGESLGKTSSARSESKSSENNPLAGAISSFLGGLSIMHIEDTRLVEVSYMSPNPEYAALAINTLFDNFIDFNLRLKSESTKQASDFLFNQIDDLRKSLSQKERELQEYGKRKELFYLSNRDTTVVEKLGDLNKAYTNAQINRVSMESIYRELKGKRFEDYPEVRRNILIQNMKQQYSDMENEYKKKSQIFKESYPEMRRLKTQMDTIGQSSKQETIDSGGKALKEAETNYQTALKQENSLKEMLDQQKSEVVSTKTDAIYYNSLKIEVNNVGALLNHLVKMQKESLLTSRMEGLQTSNIKVIEPAEVPLYPISSSKQRVFLMSLMIGLFLGGGLIFGLDWLDKTLKTPEEVERSLRIPSIGIIPALGSNDKHDYYAYSYGEKKPKSTKKKIKRIELANVVDPESSIAESYRNIRTSILLSTAEGPPKVMNVCSALPREGKTSTIVNLAVSFTNLGKKVLIIDADMRKPSIRKIFHLKNVGGLSSFLVGKTRVEDIFFKTDIKNLYVIPSGPIPPNPAELLDSKKMEVLIEKMKEFFDFVFIDSPPLVGVVDPVIISKHSEGTLLVVWGGKTPKKAVEKAKAELDKYNIKILGVVLNNLNMKKAGGHGYYHYNYNYRYRYQENESDKNHEFISAKGNRKKEVSSTGFRK